MTQQQRSDDEETEKERLTRNFNELLQELRVTQTGVQILTGFLLTVPFTQRFPDLDTVQRDGYLAILVGAVIATGFIIAPVAIHRTLFRKGEKDWVVNTANWSARAGLLFLALTMAGVVWLVFDIHPAQIALAFAPGALEALTIIAFSLGVDPAYVASHHVARFIMIAVTVPFLARWLNRKEGSKGIGE